MKKKPRYSVFISLFISALALSSCLKTISHETISGSLVDSLTGAPISDTHLQLGTFNEDFFSRRNSAAEEMIEISTNANGNFTFSFRKSRFLFYDLMCSGNLNNWGFAIHEHQTGSIKDIQAALVLPLKLSGRSNLTLQIDHRNNGKKSRFTINNILCADLDGTSGMSRSFSLQSNQTYEAVFEWTYAAGVPHKDTKSIHFDQDEQKSLLYNY